ncbi:hypothetical protein V8C86DRAFT_2539053 [Haematococcus lacustris]
MAMREHQEEFAARGYFTVAVDSRYHGERAKSEGGRQKPRDIYQDALCRAWRDGVERPYLLDTVWDLLHLVDYLVTRPEVDPKRIGITGTYVSHGPAFRGQPARAAWFMPTCNCIEHQKSMLPSSMSCSMHHGMGCCVPMTSE